MISRRAKTFLFSGLLRSFWKKKEQPGSVRFARLAATGKLAASDRPF
jgi:hypothetical protein